MIWVADDFEEKSRGFAENPGFYGYP